MLTSGDVRHLDLDAPRGRAGSEALARIRDPIADLFDL
jgi:hypothetical protein